MCGSDSAAYSVLTHEEIVDLLWTDEIYDFIGFRVSKLLLERVFPVVHGVELKDVLTREGLAVGSYRLRSAE